jgi:hypothetical protein
MLLVGVVLGWLLFGCGGTSTSSVANVQGRTISKRELSHWEAVKRAELRSSSRLAQPPSSAELQKKALAFLITSAWLQREATAQGIRVSQSEVDAMYAQLLNGPNGRAFAEGLKQRGLSRADELLLLRLARLGVKLRSKIAGDAGTTEGKQRVRDFIVAYHRRWKQRTICQPGYIVPECGNASPQHGLGH